MSWVVNISYVFWVLISVERKVNIIFLSFLSLAIRNFDPKDTIRDSLFKDALIFSTWFWKNCSSPVFRPFYDKKLSDTYSLQSLPWNKAIYTKLSSELKSPTASL